MQWKVIVLLAILVVGVAIGVYYLQQDEKEFRVPKMKDYASSPPPKLARTATLAVRKSLNKLSSSMVPPFVIIFELIGRFHLIQALYQSVHYGIPDLLGDNVMNVKDIASRTGTQEQYLHRVLRYLTASGIFVQPTPRIYGNNEISACLRSDHPNSLRNFVLHNFSPNSWKSSPYLHDTLRSGPPSPFFRAFNASAWDSSLLSGSKEELEIFQGAMTELNKLANPIIISEILSSGIFSQCKTFIDVGGGHGAFLADVLQSHPGTNGILFDMPQIISEAKSKDWFTELKNSNRIQFISGSWFDSPIPANPADCYLIRNCIHDWNDDEAISILRAIREGMKISAGRYPEVYAKKEKEIPVKLFVSEIDFIRSENEDEPFRYQIDLQMMIALDGKARNRREMEYLFEHSHFKLISILDGQTSIIQAAPI